MIPSCLMVSYSQWLWAQYVGGWTSTGWVINAHCMWSSISYQTHCWWCFSQWRSAPHGKDRGFVHSIHHLISSVVPMTHILSANVGNNLYKYIHIYWYSDQLSHILPLLLEHWLDRCVSAASTDWQWNISTIACGWLQAPAVYRKIPVYRDWTQIPIPGFLKIKYRYFSGFWYSMCVLKLPAREDAKSHWLHLFDFSPLCILMCLLKWPAWKDAKSYWLHLF